MQLMNDLRYGLLLNLNCSLKLVEMHAGDNMQYILIIIGILVHLKEQFIHFYAWYHILSTFLSSCANYFKNLKIHDLKI